MVIKSLIKKISKKNFDQKKNILIKEKISDQHGFV